jgi:hypothetical protein
MFNKIANTVSYTVRAQAQEFVFTDHFTVSAPSHTEAHAQINQLMKDHPDLINWDIKYNMTQAEFIALADSNKARATM